MMIMLPDEKIASKDGKCRRCGKTWKAGERIYTAIYGLECVDRDCVLLFLEDDGLDPHHIFTDCWGGTRTLSEYEKE